MSLYNLYYFTGTSQLFTCFIDGLYSFEAWGASGGNSASGYNGSRGGYTYGELNLLKGDSLFVYVGEAGHTHETIFSDNSAYNGGGRGGKGAWSTRTLGTSGGGATDVRLINGLWNSTDSLLSRIMVAGGGGGRDGYSGNDGTLSTPLGSAGGLFGFNGSWGRYSVTYSANLEGKGASQTSGGLNNDGTLTSGFGFGATGIDISISDSQIPGCGGGGGYFGGGGGNFGNHASSGGGGGGSSFILGHNNCILHPSSVISHRYYFSNTILLSGNDLVPDPFSYQNQVGNLGNGIMKITLLQAHNNVSDYCHYIIPIIQLLPISVLLLLLYN